MHGAVIATLTPTCKARCIDQVPGMTPPDLASYTFDNQGAAIECRINAENPSAGYAPSSGVAATACASSATLLNAQP